MSSLGVVLGRIIQLRLELYRELRNRLSVVKLRGLGGLEKVGHGELGRGSGSSVCQARLVIPFGGHADYFSAPGLTAYSLIEP
jgi:hypothetical protein